MDKEKIQILKDLSDLLEKDRISRVEFDIQKDLILKPQNSLFSLFQLIILFSKTISPQVIILILIILFYSPIKNLIINASEVGFGDVFAVKVEQALRIADSDLANILKTLTKEELTVLMSMKSVYHSITYVNQEEKLLHISDYYPYYQSLYEKKLMKATEDAEEVFNILNSKKEIEKKSTYNNSLINEARPTYYSISDFTKEELDKVENMSFGLSSQGEDALRVIIKVASEEISTLN